MKQKRVEMQVRCKAEPAKCDDVKAGAKEKWENRKDNKQKP